MISKQQAPQIRFIGFSDDWVQRELGHIAQFSKGSGYSKADLRVEGSPIILYGRLYTKYQTVIDKVDTFVDEKVNSIKSQGNEVIVPASGETAEDIARASAVKQKGIILGGDLNIVRLNDSYSPTFIALKISHGKSKSELAKKAQGKSVVHIRNSDLQSLLLKIPTFKEQTDIGNLFQNIDQTIALQRRKHEQTQTLKKSLLSKMFPQKGQSQPEIRLKGFSGDWVEVKLGNVLLIRSMSVDSDDFDVDIELENIESETGIIIGNTSVRTQANSYFARGDVLFGRLRPYLKKWWLADVEGVKSGEIWAFYSEMIESEFIYALVQTNAFLNATNVSSGSKMPRADWSSMAKVKVFIPNSKKEQTAIGQFFKQLDDTVSIQAKQLKTLENLKKALLAKMFV